MKCCTFYCLYPEIIEGGILDAQSYKLEFAPSVKLNLPLIKFQRFLVGYLFQSFVQMQVPISQNYMIWM